MNKLDLLVKETLDSLKKLLITLGVFFLILLLTWCAAVNEKRTVELTAKFDEDGNIVVFSPELDRDDYIVDISARVYKDGAKIDKYTLEIRCPAEIGDCVKKAEELSQGTDDRITVTDKNEIVFPRVILGQGSIAVDIRTFEYNHEGSSLVFCIKNNDLIIESDTRYMVLCVPDFSKPENRQSVSQEAQQ
ncbi:hypothetical protein [Neisseria sp.]|uniref:hypothetical protein n=1 Tax=Neisseria sp. TaxID=192066 RepID=UPI00359FA0C5